MEEKMREIKFRGLTVDDNKMVYGDLLQYRVYPVIFDKNKKQHEVKADTVGQFIGLLDKLAKEIYEGDICEESHHELHGACWRFIIKDISDTYRLNVRWAYVKVIGNIYQNPKLITDRRQ